MTKTQNSVFISNYNNPNGTDGETPPLCIVSAIEQHLGYDPFTSPPRAENSGFHITVNPQSIQVVHGLHASYIGGRRRLWIIKSPIPQFGQLWGAFRHIFANVSSGCARLSDLRTKVQNAGVNPTLVDFRNRDFVEFLLFSLGRISQDDGFDVEILDVSNNPIQNLNGWVPFLFFLPALHVICCENCGINVKPQLPPYILVQGLFNQKQKGKQGSNDKGSNFHSE
jgi:hypothetical protein